MILTYIPRLICLALSCFFASFTITSLFVTATRQWAVPFAATRQPRRAANLLLLFRLLPITLATYVSLGLCVPSYMLFEPEIAAEPVGSACLAMAFLGLAISGLAIVRGTAALCRSFAFTRRCLQGARETSFSFHPQPMWIIETPAPYLALTGILRPRVIISRGIVEALSPEELSAVLSHENAHQKAFDNLKRLLLRLAPGPRALDQSWAAFAEYAADHQAVGTDHLRSIALASALVRVARFGRTPFGKLALPSTVATAFLAEPSELTARVNRLLATPTSTPSLNNPWLKLLQGLFLLAVIFQPFALRILHSFLERLL